MAEKIEAIKVSLNQALNDKEKPWKKALDLAEEKSGVPRLYIFGGKFSYTHTHTNQSQLITEDPSSSKNYHPHSARIISFSFLYWLLPIHLLVVV